LTQRSTPPWPRCNPVANPPKRRRESLLPSPIEVATPQATTTQSEKGATGHRNKPDNRRPYVLACCHAVPVCKFNRSELLPKSPPLRCCAENAMESKNLRFLIAHTCQIHYGRAPRCLASRGRKLSMPGH
jgi:hypothetical protein